MSRNSKSRKISDFVALGLFLLVGFLMVLEAVRLINVRIHIKDNTVNNVISTYDWKKIRASGNISYSFTLADGDRIHIPGELLENRELLEREKELFFSYASPRGGIRFTYACVEITSVDREIYFVRREAALREITGGIWVFLIVGLAVTVLAGVVMVAKLSSLNARHK